MPVSKGYPVKSSAARAAKAYGIGRDALRQNENMCWVFDIPEGVKPAPQPRKAKADKPAPAAKPAKAKASKPKAKAGGRVTRGKNGKLHYRNTFKVTPKRKAGAKTGKTAEFIKECKARFVSAPDAMKRYGWTSNTLRGVLGNNKLKNGEDFERKKIEGVTHYRIAA